MDDVVDSFPGAAQHRALPTGFPAVLVKLYKGPVYRDRHSQEWQSPPVSG